MKDAVEYGFTKDGGFAAVSHARRVAAYAYPSSPSEQAARKDAAKAACDLMRSELHWIATGAQAAHYRHIAAKLAGVETQQLERIW